MSLFRPRDAPRDDRILACPRDKSPLAKVEREGVVVDRCGECRGAWFDARELRAVAEDREVEKLAAHVSRFARDSGFACLRCGAGCKESHVADVAVDTCPACHGVWLDGGELEEAKREVETQRILSGAPLGFRGFLTRL